MKNFFARSKSKILIKYTIIFGAMLPLYSLNIRPFTPKDEYPLSLYLPDDLQVSLWAETPLLYNPSNMDTDAKGRIWVTEAVNYRNFNHKDQPFLSRAEGDRIVILQDTNNDGKADNSKVYVQDKDLVAPLGIAVLGNEVIVSCAPHLIKYTDLNGDDKPDKKEILLTGFGGKDHDHSLHSVVAGPDGAYFFNVGNAGPHRVTDKAGFTIRSGSLYTGGSPYNTENEGNQKSDDGKVWVGGLQMKMNTDATGLKVLAHNFRNSYETYIDGRGDMWQNDNDDQVVTCRVSWLAEGGNAGFFSEDGTRYWNADHRPNQSMWQAHWHQDDPGVMPAGDNSGAGSPTGMLRNEGDGLGAKYRGTVLSCDAGRNTLFAYNPSKTGSGYNLAGKRSIFITSNKEDDKAYQWNNKDFDQNKTKWFRPSDALIGTDGALYIADWFDAVVGGHQVKDEQAYGRIYRITPKDKILRYPTLDFTTVQGLKQAFKNPAVNVRNQAFVDLKKQENLEIIAKELAKDSNPFTAARAQWLMAEAGSKGQSLLKVQLKTGSEDQKIVAFRALRQKLAEKDLLSLVAGLKNEPSAFVRREALVAVEKIEYNKKAPVIKALLRPNADTYYCNAVAFALGQNTDQFYQTNSGILQQASYFNQLFALRPASAVVHFLAIAKSEKAAVQKRKMAIDALAFINTKAAVEAMFSLQSVENKTLSNQAKYWLAYRSSNNWLTLYNWSETTADLEAQKILTQMLKNKEKLLNTNIALWDRKAAMLQMTENETGAQILLDILRKNAIESQMATLAKEKLNQSTFTAIRLQAQGLAPNSTENQAYLQAEIFDLIPHTAAGQKVFNKHCTNCHKMETVGANIGPDLTQISSKLDKIGLYEAIVYPNSSVVFGYEATTIAMKDGNSYYGFVQSENQYSITIKDLAGKRTALKKSDILNKTMENKSLMPAAKSLNISNQELADLLAYLSKSKV